MFIPIVGRHRKAFGIAMACLSLVVITAPEWTASVWSLFSSKPLWLVLSPKLRELKLPPMSPYFFTVPLSLIIFTVTWFELRKTRPVAVPRIEELEDRELREMATKWLAIFLSDRRLQVQRASLFGSIVHDHYPTLDVDVVVTLRSLPDRKAAKVGRKIKTEMRRESAQRFGHPLHVQLFGADEEERLTKFLQKAGMFENISLGG